MECECFRRKRFYCCDQCRVVYQGEPAYEVRVGTKDRAWRIWYLCSFACYRAHLAGY